MNFEIQFGVPKMKKMTMMNSISSPSDAQRGAVNIYSDPMGMNNMMSRHMQDVFQMISGMFGDVGNVFDDEPFNHFGSVADITPDAPQDGNIRDHYLKPGYNCGKGMPKQDIDLDGKVSSEEIAGLLKRRDFVDPVPESVVTKGSFFQTIVTKSITKPDGTVETRRIVKDHLGNVEETFTTHRDGTGSSDAVLPNDPFLQENIFKNFTSFWKIF